MRVDRLVPRTRTGASLKLGSGRKSRKNNNKKKLCWVTSSFSAQLVLWVAFGLAASGAARSRVGFCYLVFRLVLSWFHTLERRHVQYWPTRVRGIKQLAAAAVGAVWFLLGMFKMN